MAGIGILIGLTGAAIGILIGLLGGLVGVAAHVLGGSLHLLAHPFPVLLIIAGIILLAKGSKRGSSPASAPYQGDAALPQGPQSSK